MENFINEQEDYALTDSEIFTKIWYKPRMVFRYINDNHYDKYVTILLIGAGISRGLDRAINKNMVDSFSLWSVLAISIIFGGLLGWISFYIYSKLLNVSGKWLGGSASTTGILNMLSHALIPTVIASLCILIQVMIHGNSVFKDGYDLIVDNFSDHILSSLLIIGQIILSFYSIILCIIGLSEIQNFSVWRAMLNLLFPVLIILIPIILIVFIFGSF